ncbi:NTP transferase domain-containing protein [Candidatus Saccharibacteria bacterium]|nr:NTP transferase domain-containing protein [Candidatus Saccharibacteria bacterium]
MSILTGPTELTHTEFEILTYLTQHRQTKPTQLYQALSILNLPTLNTSIETLAKNQLLTTIDSKISISELGRRFLEPYRVKRAVILAAGRGSRMRPETDIRPKPMVWVGKKRIIETQLDALISAGITDITIVRGYRSTAFDLLLNDYPNLKFIDNSSWDSTTALKSTSLASHLLANAYLIEGDIFIRNPKIIRPYEYQSTYCGIPSSSNDDWFFDSRETDKIQHIWHGNAYKFVGIMYWSSDDAKKLQIDIDFILEHPRTGVEFAESIPFQPDTNDYDVSVRPIQHNDAIEIDTFDELQALRKTTVN